MLLNFQLLLLGLASLSVPGFGLQYPNQSILPEDPDSIFQDWGLSRAARATKIYCPAETIVDLQYGNFEFAATRATVEGTLVKIPCPFETVNNGAEPLGSTTEGETVEAGGERACYMINGKSNGTWDSFRHFNCREKKVTDTIFRVKQQVAQSPVFNAYNIRQLLPLLYGLFAQALRDYESATVLVDTVSRVLESVDLFSEGDELGVREIMFKYLADYTAHVQLERGERVRVKAGDIAVETALFPQDNQVYSYSFESFSLPHEALEMGKASGRLQIQAFSDNLFFHWGQDRDWAGGNGTVNGTALPFKSGWRIFSVEFKEAQVGNLTTPVSYSYALNDSAELEWVCAYWDEGARAWSTTGMTTLKVGNSIRCESTHLTAFSVLIQPVPGGSGSDGNDLVLSILSSVLSAVSMTGLAGTSLTYIIFRKLRRERSNQVLLNLTLSLLFLHATSLSASKSVWRSLCVLPTVLLHYFLLASFGWMLCYGLHLFRILVRVFVKPETRFILKRCVLAWGIPLLIVSLAALIDSEVYSAGRGDMCVFGGDLNPALYYSLYLGPIVIIMVTNGFVFIRIILILLKQSSRTRHQLASGSGADRLPSFLSPIQIRGTITLFVLLGSGWIVGLLAVGPLEVVATYANVILNAGQGLLIFVFRVLLDPNAMNAWRRTVLNLSDSEMSFTTSSSQQGRRKTVGGGPYTISPTFISSATNSAQSSITTGNPLGNKLASSLFSILQQEQKDSEGTAPAEDPEEKSRL